MCRSRIWQYISISIVVICEANVGEKGPGFGPYYGYCKGRPKISPSSVLGGEKSGLVGCCEKDPE